MIVNVLKLKGKIVEKQTSQEAVAKAIGIDRSTFYRRIADDGNSFTIKEVREIAEAIPLDRDEVLDIFFPV